VLIFSGVCLVNTEVKKHSTGDRFGLRTIAFFEASKGFLVLFVGFGLTAYLHHDAKHLVESVTHHFEMYPTHHSAVFIRAAKKASDMNLWLLASGSLGYSLLRFAEAYGLWTERVWAEWLAIASGGLYLPFEVYELTVRVTVIKLVITSLNLIIVAYLVWERLKAKKLKGVNEN
jgi:uncharacterized membrane protein (DUF2068 family)